MAERPTIVDTDAVREGIVEGARDVSRRLTGDGRVSLVWIAIAVLVTVVAFLVRDADQTSGEIDDLHETIDSNRREQDERDARSSAELGAMNARLTRHETVLLRVLRIYGNDARYLGQILDAIYTTTGGDPAAKPTRRPVHEQLEELEEALREERDPR